MADDDDKGRRLGDEGPMRPPTSIIPTSTPSSSATVVSSPHIRIVACGYQSILIAKSQLCFPAWLVEFSNDDDANDNNHEQHNNKSSSDSYYWRSKRDFLHLARAATSNDGEEATDSTNNNKKRKILHFPKAAFQKLAKKAPWQRPQEQAEAVAPWHDVIQEACQNSNKKDSTGMNVSAATDENHWHNSMRKSLYQLDQFLQQARTILLLQRKQDNHDKDHHQASESSLSWHNGFGRPRHCESLLLQQSQPQKQPQITSKPQRTQQPQPHIGNDLGQYFCHPQLAHQVVETCLDRLERHLLLETEQANDQDDCQILLVEPSCGHGQMVQVLLERLSLLRRERGNTNDDTTTTPQCWPLIQDQLKRKRIRIRCLDKDPAAVEHCRRKFATTRMTRMTNDEDNDESSIPMEWECGDFLQSTLPRMDDQNQDNNNNNNNKTIVACFGGPPYSAGAGHGTVKNKNTNNIQNNDIGMMQRDLPWKFVRHALTEYNAAVVAFLMPQRCAKEVGRMQEQQQQQQDKDGNDIKGAGNGDTDNEGNGAKQNDDNHGTLWGQWSYQNIDLKAPSVFYFQGQSSAAVVQPSILQCFWKPTKRVATDTTG